MTETTHSDARNLASNWRHSKWLAIGELVVVALIFVADAHHLIPFSKTPFLLLFGWISLWVRKIGWRRVGLKLYRNWKARRRIAQLETYDDHMLNDIGLTRDEISWAAGLPLTVNSALALEDRAFRRRKNFPQRPGWGVY